MGMFNGESYETMEYMKKMFIKGSFGRMYNFGPLLEISSEDINFDDNDLISQKNPSNYEILDDEDESFIQGREDPKNK